MSPTFQRLAIVNRGEPAMRLIHAVREWNCESPGEPPIRAIALYTEPERHAMFVREADEAVSLGDATFVDERDGERKPAYLHYGRVEDALDRARADAVWVGWGFVSEHAEFVALCERRGIVFLGPSSRAMRQLGDKIAAKRIAEQAAVPVAPWSNGPVASLADARRHADRIGFPLMIKATAGGGGRGIRRVTSAAELAEAFERARGEALRAFGDDTVFMERLVPGARHIEVQVIGDSHGTTWAVGVRDCTIQRRHQKVLEESPSPVLRADQDAQLREIAARLCRAVGYTGAGTVEFLYDPVAQSFVFMEVNARLQVEHPVTEATTGLDLVKLQLHVARGGRLEGPPPPTRGHAIEVRINAEDPEHGFAPAPGALALLRLPTGPGLRIDTGLCEGGDIPPEFDSMIAKLIATGRDRGEAIARLRRALAETLIVVRGGTTNKSFLLGLLDQPAIADGTADNAWLDRNTAALVGDKHGEVALIAAAIESYEAEWLHDLEEFFSTAVRGRPHLKDRPGHVVELRLAGRTERLGMFRLRPGHYRACTGGAVIEVSEERIGAFERWLTIGDRRYRVVSCAGGAGYRIEVDGVEHQIMKDDPGLVRSPIPAVVLAIRVRPGDAVAAGDRLVVLEAMKMEAPVLAPFDGVVGKVHVTCNVQVPAGAPLVWLSPAASVTALPVSGAAPLDFAALAAAPPAETAARLAHNLAELRALLLGFDVDAAAARAQLAEYRELCRLAADDPALARGEEALLGIYADLCALSQREPGVDDPDAGHTARSEEYLFTYLRAPQRLGSGLPASFLSSLRQALSPHGVRDLELTPELRDGLLRICKAERRLDAHGDLMIAVLERWLGLRAPPSGLAWPELRALLDRLVLVTHGRNQALCDLSREVRYRYFDRPLFDDIQDRTYAEMDEQLRYLHEHPEAPDREARIAVLVDCPLPLVGVLARQFQTAPPALADLMLEVLTRRYYRIRPLQFRGCRALSSQRCAIAEYDLDDRRIHCVAVHAEYARFGEALRACGKLVDDLPADHDVVVDVYLVRPDGLAPADATQAELARVLEEAAPARPLRRIVAMVAGATGGRGISSVQHFTYRRGEAGYVEQKLYRGLHPMMGKRLDLWRLGNFEIERLPSVEDVYLFQAVGRENPRDRRLFVYAEVRDLAAVRDAAGRVVQLPTLNHMLMEALASMRAQLWRLPPADRPAWNRVLLFLWPPLDLTADELDGIVHRLAPLAEGLGIEQVMVRARIPRPGGGGYDDTVIRVSNPGGTGLRITSGPPPEREMRPMSEYDQKVARMSRRGLTYPYALIDMLTSARGAVCEFPPGEFLEYDLDLGGQLVPVTRPAGNNAANIVVGLITNHDALHPDGMIRVLLVGDASHAMGAVAEPECRRIMAAIDLAAGLGVPVEWFALSAGAKISMDSGTENMDQIAAVLRRIIEFTQAGGEINVVVTGINVGAQPYWNAEATMLMHTRGVLIMTPHGAMVLTGKQALDYSGSVSAEDNQGIGGYERIMGPNGQAQYWARDLTDAIHVLFRHYEHCYVVPGERFPRRAPTGDPPDRDIGWTPLGGATGFRSVGDIFSAEHNPGRKLPFDIRAVMGAAIDQDLPPLERWAGMRDAEIAVVWDAHLGGYPVCLIGIESRPLPRLGYTPADGPEQFTAGTLFPRSSKKIARAINAASGNRPVVILANLSGFDGSPESLRELQLEFGAEIGRAVVNFAGPMVFCVVSRYHGGAYVVFSSRLNDGLEVAALEGSFASVIGGTPAAAVVFAGEVEKRARADARVVALAAQLEAAHDAGERSRLRAQLDASYAAVHAEKLGEIAEAFDRVHSVERARRVGSLHHIIPARGLRPYLISAVERGIANAARRAARVPAAAVVAAPIQAAVAIADARSAAPAAYPAVVPG